MTPRRIGLMLLSLALLTVAGSAAWWLSRNLVRSSAETFTGYGVAAQRNPFYAAERLLTRLGRTVHSVRWLNDARDALDPADTLLVAMPTYAPHDLEQRRWLMTWVSQGGHLIISVQHEFETGERHDPLLDALRVNSRRVESAPPEPVSVTLGDATPPLRVRFQSNLRLNDALWMPVKQGKGQVTLLTDMEVFSNDRLADYDHPDFLWALVQYNSGGQIWLQYQSLTPSLAQLLWRHAWMLLIGLLLTLLAALWHYSRRLGPLLVARSAEQRRLAEHLQASSRFLWRQGAGPVLLQAARQYTLRRLERRRLGAGELLAAALDDSDQPLTEHALLRTLQTLQRLNRPR